MLGVTGADQAWSLWETMLGCGNYVFGPLKATFLLLCLAQSLGATGEVIFNIFREDAILIQVVTGTHSNSLPS